MTFYKVWYAYEGEDCCIVEADSPEEAESITFDYATHEVNYILTVEECGE